MWWQNKQNQYLHENKRHILLPLAKNVLRVAVSHCDGSYYCTEIMCTAEICAFLLNIYFNVLDVNQIISEACNPLHSSFVEYFNNATAKKVSWLRSPVRGKVLYMLRNRGNMIAIAHF